MVTSYTITQWFSISFAIITDISPHLSSAFTLFIITDSSPKEKYSKLIMQFSQFIHSFLEISSKF